MTIPARSSRAARQGAGRGALGSVRCARPGSNRRRRRRMRGRAETESTNLEDAFSVALLVSAHLQYLFITCALAFGHESRSEPPDEGVKPEDGLDDHVEQGAQVVLPMTWHASWARMASSSASDNRSESPAGHSSLGLTIPRTPGSMLDWHSRSSIGRGCLAVRARRCRILLASLVHPSRSLRQSRQAYPLRPPPRRQHRDADAQTIAGARRH